MNLRHFLTAAAAICLSAAAAVAAVPAKAPDPESMGMTMVWNDEFNRRDINKRIWNFERGFVRNQELQYYQPDNADLRGGKLRLRARPDSRPNPGYQPGSTDWTKNRENITCTSASMTTRAKMDFTYGILQVRAKIPTDPGAWPAIWLLGYGLPWPANGEIDVMEYYPVKGVPSLLANAAWASDKPHDAVWSSATVSLDSVRAVDPRWDDDYHVWTLDWTPEYIRIYVDDLLINDIDITATVNGSGGGQGINPFTRPHFLLLNLAVGGSKGGEPDFSRFPLEYDIDYVRLYQNPDAINVSIPSLPPSKRQR